ncbi:MAG TPA: DUF969 domain-containing protein [Hyphomonadaceae bacterium]|nr:DUF969 domain-containing protein [Hyphomonadaceae bacterium]
MLVLLGIGVVVLGFVVRANPLLVVMAAAITTGLAAAWTPNADLAVMWNAALTTLATFGKAFNDNRFITLVWMLLIVIGLLERSGLQERARIVISSVPAATSAGVLWVYFIFRQILSAFGLTSLGGQAQMVRPLVAPMAEGAAESRHGPLPDKERYLIRSHSAAVDNIALFFGEDIFIAIGSIGLMVAFLKTNNIEMQPFDLSMWAIPTALCVFVVHSTRLFLLNRKLERALAAAKVET